MCRCPKNRRSGNSVPDDVHYRSLRDRSVHVQTERPDASKMQLLLQRHPLTMFDPP